ncbi:type II toxin-antitoxin system Phd/YefM family antitoxin [Microlunatus elymi]|uniref:Type II toxin-antitoxin system Phd/YefM family antitoxin n=1 Tax=Microlunatus elymi TaxID=2596828 RepID=A0A516PX58_9ACTN|nr:type II toxin-antitoxin system Phd/YefM family antitoxin [Microlunatus elymi]QDP95742.1 type II toxin-antitoxin system Phd/YefM family antitoxin [Microlunatus elymi]
MKTISIGQLRQNPAPMIADLESGEVYSLTRHNREIGRIIPTASSAGIVPRKVNSPARTREIRRHELRSATSIDELLASDKGDW